MNNTKNHKTYKNLLDKQDAVQKSVKRVARVKKTDKVASSNGVEEVGAADKRTKKRKTGDTGERVACSYLHSLGFEIVDRNYLKKFGEIDIVAKKGDIYYFYEVKTATILESTVNMLETHNVTHVTGDFLPEDKVNGKKLRNLARTIETYILEKKIYDYEWTFGVLVVTLNMQTRLARVKALNNVNL
jgi:putative endonuclease